MGFEDNIPTIEEINDTIAKQKAEVEQKRLETIAKMEQNRIEEEQRKKDLIALVEALGIKQQQEDLDVLKQAIQAMNVNINAINESLIKIVGVVDQHTQILNGQPQAQQAGPATNTPNEMKLMQLGELAKTFADVWHTIKGQPAPQVGIPGLDANALMSEAVEAVHDDFSIGKELRTAIKSSIRKKVVGNVISNVLRDDSAIDHAPA